MGTDLRLTVAAKRSDDGETGGCQFCDRYVMQTARELPVTVAHTVYVAETPRSGVSARTVMCRFCISELFAGVKAIRRASSKKG
jgi:hypothetical protein